MVTTKHEKKVIHGKKKDQNIKSYDGYAHNFW